MTNISKYSATLLIEDNIISEVLQNKIEQLKEKLNGDPYFASVDTYKFKGREKLELTDENNNIVDNFKNNNVVFVISDLSSVIWRNTVMHSFLSELKDNALVNLITYWNKDPLKPCAVETETQATMSISVGAKNYKNSSPELPPYMYKYYSESLFLPTATLETVPQLIHDVVHGGTVETAQIFKENMIPANMINHDAEKVAESKLNRFRYNTSLETYQLAAYFSEIESFNMSDVEFVQQHMLPGTSTKILNDFMTAGLIEHAANNTATEPQYKVKEDISKVLMRSLRNKDADAVELLLQEKRSQPQKYKM